MNYERIYNQIIERSKSRVLDGYTEKHHIIPKCLGGCNESYNIAILTAREHFLCHWLLCRIYSDNRKIKYAFWAMCNTWKSGRLSDRHIPSNRAYEEARILFSEMITKTPNKKSDGKILTEYRKWIGIRNGEGNPMYGRHHSDESKEKMRISNSGVRNGMYRKSNTRVKVAKMDMNTNTIIHIFDSITEANRSIGKTTVGLVCRGILSSAGGFCWKYI